MSPEDIISIAFCFYGSKWLLLLGLQSHSIDAYMPGDFRHNVCIASYRSLFLCDVMAVRRLPFQRRGTLTLRLVLHTRRCIGSSSVYLRVPDEEDIRVLSDIIDFVSRSGM